MILYHGSYVEVSAPDLSYSRDNLDFGKGFYTTTIYEQAKKWCAKFKRNNQKGVVSSYSFDNKACESLKIKVFDMYDEEWIDFILSCRNGDDTSDYDIVEGGIANDKVFNTVELYFSGLIDKKEALNRLRFEKPNWQVCFRTNKALGFLKFEGSEEV